MVAVCLCHPFDLASVFVGVTCQSRQLISRRPDSPTPLSILLVRSRDMDDVMDLTRGGQGAHLVLGRSWRSIDEKMEEHEAAKGDQLCAFDVQVFVMSRCAVHCMESSRVVGQRCCDPRRNRANGRGPGITGEGQQRVEGQTFEDYEDYELAACRT